MSHSGSYARLLDSDIQEPLAPVKTCPVVRPLFLFYLDRTSGEPTLATVDHQPTDDFEGVPWDELNDFDWQASSGGPWVSSDQYAAFDLDGQVLSLVSLDSAVASRHHVDSYFQWMLVGTGTYDLPRLQELATRSAERTAFEPGGEDPLLEIANRAHKNAEAMRLRQGWLSRRLFDVKEVQPPTEHYYTR